MSDWRRSVAAAAVIVGAAGVRDLKVGSVASLTVIVLHATSTPEKSEKLMATGRRHRRNRVGRVRRAVTNRGAKEETKEEGGARTLVVAMVPVPKGNAPVGHGAGTARRVVKGPAAAEGEAGRLTAIGLMVIVRRARHAQAVLAARMVPRRARWTAIARLLEIAGAVTVVRSGKGLHRVVLATLRLPHRVTNLPVDAAKGRANADALHSGRQWRPVIALPPEGLCRYNLGVSSAGRLGRALFGWALRPFFICIA